jgi:outer membrane protein assembly factor BamB
MDLRMVKKTFHSIQRRSVALRAGFAVCFMLCAIAANARADESEVWTAKLDRPVRFYQTTELGVLIVGTEKSLYVVDGASGEIVWRRKNVQLEETDVTAIPGTDLVLLSFQKGDRTRVEATDILTGDSVWRTDKVRGGVMQMAVDANEGLLAAVFVRDARGKAKENFKRKPVVHVFELATGDELWKRELGSEIEMMPARFSNQEDEKKDEVDYTLNNYHPPLFLDSQLYVFYEGFTSFDARTGKERLRERFRVNEEGLALTEADPIFDSDFIYASGRGRVRALSRATGEVAWEAKDLGETPELFLAGTILYARTGGQFTRLRDGETIERGPFGVSAIDARKGATLWRYKGADKGITNIAVPDPSTILIADRDDLINIDARTGKRRARVSHKIENAAFLLINERGEAILGGRNELAAFDVAEMSNVWRARHTPPSRGILRITAAIALRAASIYFRYGGVATTAFRGAQLAQAASGGLRWSGLEAARAALPNLQTLATTAAREKVTTAQFVSFGALTRLRQTAPSLSTATTLPDASAIRSRVTSEAARRVAGARPVTTDVEDRLLDRLDPAQQLDRLSAFLLRRRRLAALRGAHMYFYTDLERSGGRGLAGVSINTGRTDRSIRVSNPDPFFIVDEASNLLYNADSNRLRAYAIEGAL